MYIITVPNRNSPPAILLRESFREKGKVKNRTLANLSKLPPDSIELLRRSIKGEKFLSADKSFEIIKDGSPAHGHIDAVLTAMKRLNFSSLISSRTSRERDLVVAMVVARILEPQSKLATTQWWKDTTLPEILGISDADEDDLYGAMDWLLGRQKAIEKKIANRHLENNGLALYDLTSSYFEGETCPLAALGHNRDGKKGKLQVNYGLLTNRSGIPVAVSVFKGNIGDPTTLMPQVDKMIDEFGINEFVLVGDRGMLTQKQIEILQGIEGTDWIGALRPEAIKKIFQANPVQMSFFDKKNLFELKHLDFPGERLVACRNPILARRRMIKREKLLEATVKELQKVRRMVHRGRLHGKKEIETRLQKILKGYRIGKHFQFNISGSGFTYEINEANLFEKLTAKGGSQDQVENRINRSRGHIEAIKKKLEKVSQMIKHGRLHGKDLIGVRVGKVIGKYKMGKHFILNISDDDFTFEVNANSVKEEAALDGIYIIRTSLPESRMSADDAVRSYKLLGQAERAFRSFKTVDLMVRPIRHRLENRVRAHIFICMLAYYVLWHMQEAWRPLLFADEDQEAKLTRDPVSPAIRSESALEKVKSKKITDGSRVHSLRTLLRHLSAIVRVTCQQRDGEANATFTMDTIPNPTQQKAFDLLQAIHL